MSAANEVHCVHCCTLLRGDALEASLDGACADQWECIGRQIRSRGLASVPELDALLATNRASVAMCARWDQNDSEVQRSRRAAVR